MGYSLHVPLAFGRLKFKSESRLRQREKDCRVTVWRFGSLYVVWEARRKMPSPTAKIQLETRPSRPSSASRPPRPAPPHKYRTANAIAKCKARLSAITTRITVCAFDRFEGGFCGGATSHLVTRPPVPLKGANNPCRNLPFRPPAEPCPPEANPITPTPTPPANFSASPTISTICSLSHRRGADGRRQPNDGAVQRHESGYRRRLRQARRRL